MINRRRQHWVHVYVACGAGKFSKCEGAYVPTIGAMKSLTYSIEYFGSNLRWPSCDSISAIERMMTAQSPIPNRRGAG